MGWGSGSSAAADTFMGGTGVHSECGIRHKDCKCWDEDPDWEEEDDE